MADLTVTAANVIPGATLTPGQPYYLYYLSSTPGGIIGVATSASNLSVAINYTRLTA